MKKVIVMALIMVFAFSLGAYAMKIGYVDREKVFTAYSGTKKAKEVLQNELDAEKKALEKEQEDLIQASQDLKKRRTVLDKKKADEMEADLQRKAQALQQKALEIQQQLLTKEKEMYSQILDEIRAIVVKIAKDRGYNYVFERESLLFGGDDITAFVIREMNK